MRDYPFATTRAGDRWLSLQDAPEGGALPQ